METDFWIPDDPDRRRNPRLRSIFPDARIRIDRLFHSRHDWAGSPEDFLALRLLHESYPYLESGEVRTLMLAIARRVRQEAQRGRQ